MTVVQTNPSREKADRAHPVLSVRGLTTRFRTDRGVVTAVDDVSFDVFPGETVGVVGESGCGKTVTSKSIMRLLPERTSEIDPTSRVEYTGGSWQSINLVTASNSEMRRVRGDQIAMIFQEPMTSLNPVFTVGWQLDEALKYHTRLSKKERRARSIEMLRLVEIPNPEKRIDEYPHQLSGGMRQRVMIAMALVCEPRVLIADEPTTALDVTIQAQILDLMQKLKEELETAIVLITHDLGVVAQVCDRVLVMYAGRVIEEAPVGDLFRAPDHPYTRALLDSIPKAGRKAAGDDGRTVRLATIPGIVPSLFDLPSGCRFQDRCSYKQERCIAEEPALVPTSGHGRGERACRCHSRLNGPDAVAPHAPEAAPGRVARETAHQTEEKTGQHSDGGKP